MKTNTCLRASIGFAIAIFTCFTAQGAWKVDPDFRPLPTFGYSLPPITAIQSDGKFIVDSGRQRLNADGRVDPTFSSPNNGSREVWISPTGQLFAVYPPNDAGVALLAADGSETGRVPTGMPIPRIGGFLPDGRVIVHGFYATDFGTQWPAIIRLNASGTVDPTFSSAATVNDTGVIVSVVIQSDGKVLIAGTFATIGGVARPQLARLNANGSLDTTFDAGAAITPILEANWSPEAIAIDAQGRVLRADRFEIRRYGANGQSPVVLNTVNFARPGSRPRPQVTLLLPQSDGRLMVAGSFTAVGTSARRGLARLNADGSVDESFDAGMFTSGTNESDVASQRIFPAGSSVLAQTVTGDLIRLADNGQPDATFSLAQATGGRAAIVQVAPTATGQLVVGGRFTHIDDTRRLGLARLNGDGTLDAAFDPGNAIVGEILAVAVQSDGKVLAAGDFFTAGGVSRRALVRFHADGLIDASFNAGYPSGAVVSTIAVQTDGRIIAGGRFTVGFGATNLARFLPTGAIDPAFTLTSGATGPIAEVNSVELLPNGQLLVGGTFTAWNGTARAGVVRLHSDGTPDLAFDPGGGTSGAVLEVSAAPDGSVAFNDSFARTGRLEPNGGLRYREQVSAGFGALFAETASETLVSIVHVADNGAPQTLAPFSVVSRFRADGSKDPSLALEFTDGFAHDIAPEPGGSVVIAGSFVEADGMDYAGLLRLVPDIAAPRLANISTRGYVGTNQDVLIAGFFVAGSEPQRVLIRGIGYHLADFGILNHARDTSLTVFRQGEGAPFATNQGWYRVAVAFDDPGRASNSRLQRSFDRLGAFPLRVFTAGGGTTFSNDCGLILDLPPGGYTVHLGAAGSGVGLVEVYDANGVGAVRKLINISTRGRVGTGDERLIAGFVVDRGTKRVLIRAVGPGIASLIAGTLANPTIDLVRQSDQVTIASNDNWSDNANAAVIAAASLQVTGLQLASGSADAALLVDLPAGSYTVIASGVGATTGIALVEVYEVP